MTCRMVAVALLLGAAGCGGTYGPAPFPVEGESTILQIMVDNRNFNDANIIFLSDRGEKRLGVVDGKSERTFSLPWPRPDLIRLRVRLLAGGTFTTSGLEANPGELLVLEIRSNLRAATFRR